MKRTILSFLTGVILLVTLCLFPLSATAAQAATVTIPVEIVGGGTARVIPEVNCPLPEVSSVEVQDGATENINISFFETGNFSYTIEADTKDDSYYSPAYYTASVTVRKDGSGELIATVILSKPDSDYKPDRCLFTPGEPPSDAPASVETQPANAEQAPKNPPTSRPKTGDDSMLDIYLLICIAASGGLFMLSVIYSVSTNRLIGRK